MIDAPDRIQPRFPASLERYVALAIDSAIEELAVGTADVGVGSGACGSDILIAESLLRRDIPLELYLPFSAPVFIRESVSFAGPSWVSRFSAIARRASVHVATESLGPFESEDPYAKNNLWMLNEACRISNGSLVLISVWDGNTGDGPGGTEHMVRAVQELGGEVRLIKPPRHTLD
jgi:hypothetical protein